MPQIYALFLRKGMGGEKLTRLRELCIDWQRNNSVMDY
jgi:hypothetical protein